MRDRRQAGEGRIGFIITLVVVGALFFVGSRIVPARIDAYEFREVLREEARYASVHKDDGNVRERIVDKAETLEIPLDPKNLNIRRTKSEVIISANYQVPIDLELTVYTFKFDAEQRAPLF